MRMTLVFIYGPPAVGKWTVGRQLAERTGYRLFHNHLSIDCVRSVFDLGTPSFAMLAGLIRNEVIAEAARQGVDLIFTYSYTKGADDRAILTLTRMVEDVGGRICFVQLTCAKSAQESRVVNPVRAQMGKLAELAVLRAYIASGNRNGAFLHRPNLRLDTTHLAPEETAEKIIAQYRLQRT